MCVDGPSTLGALSTGGFVSVFEFLLLVYFPELLTASDDGVGEFGVEGVRNGSSTEVLAAVEIFFRYGPRFPARRRGIEVLLVAGLESDFAGESKLDSKSILRANRTGR